jgi:hypothetical protein
MEEGEKKNRKKREETATTSANYLPLFDVHFVTFGKLKVFVTKQSASIHLGNGLM